MEPSKHVCKTQIIICVLLFVFCIFLRVAPDDSYKKAKDSITAILTVNTDFRAEWENIKRRFAKEEALESLAPVSEMIAPTKGDITKGFGMQDASKNDFHYGVLLSCAENENVLAANDGEVTEVATNQEYGSFMIIRHSENLFTLYGNLNEILPNVGETVSKGQPIARCENEKDVYFELRRGETYLNPAEFITFGADAHD